MDSGTVVTLVLGMAGIILTIVVRTSSLSSHISSRLTRIETKLEISATQQQHIAETLEEHTHECDRNRVEINGRLAEHDRRFLRLEPKT